MGITYVDEAIAKLKACDMSMLNTLVTKVEQVADDARGHKYAAHAASILETSEVTEGVSNMSINNKVLMERLDVWQEYKTIPKKPNIIKFPPEPQPIPCKPLFFDLALNHIELPNLEHRMEKKESGGITGFVKGWLWGR